MAAKHHSLLTYNKELPSIKLVPFYDVSYLVILISVIQFVGLERKRLSHHQLILTEFAQGIN